MKYKFKLIDRFGELFFDPLGSSDFQIEYSKEDDDALHKYSKTFNGTLKIQGDAFRRLMIIENSIYRCTYQNIIIYKACLNEKKERVYNEIFNGLISLNEAEFDLVNCIISIKFEENKPEQCLIENKSVEVDLLGNIYDRVEVFSKSGNVFLEKVIYNHSSIDSDENGNAIEVSTGYFWDENSGISINEAFEQKWRVLEHFYNVQYSKSGNITNVAQSQTTTWVREKIENNCSDSNIPTGVYIIENRCEIDGKIIYANAPILILDSRGDNTSGNPSDNQYNLSGWENYKIAGVNSDGESLKFRNGMKLKSILELFASNFCKNFSVKSDFFQINPYNETKINYVTKELSTVSDIVVFQKSDVKRPTANNAATKANYTFDKLTEALFFMFNVVWWVENDILRFEHITYFDKKIGIDLTLEKFKDEVKAKNKYSYQTEKIPQKETFKFEESLNYSDFGPLEIVYSGACVGTSKNEKNYVVEKINNDIEFIISNPDSQSDKVDDLGFVFMSTFFDGNTYSILTKQSLNGTNPRLNNVFSFSYLFNDFHKYDRPLKSGLVNGVETEFVSQKPTKQLEKILIPFCCGDIFNPDDLVKHNFGNGLVENATFDFKNETLELQLLFDPLDNLTPNKKPIIKNKVLNIYNDEDIVIELEIEDDGIIEKIDFASKPTNGIAQIIDKKVYYSPNRDFVGNDYFSVFAVDDWNEVSNNAMISINVRSANAGPIANNDYYDFYSSQTILDLEIGANDGIFKNDSDDYGYKLKDYDKIGSNGGNITINNDGSFKYTRPNNNFYGIDSFNYSIIDDRELTASATIFIKSINNLIPKANPDFYQTTKDVVLNIDGNTNSSLISNDETPGGVYELTAIAENKTTENGGNVEIFSNGLFNYTPLSGFIGVDKFNYSVSNSEATAQGLATINVNPIIYVSMVSEISKTDVLTILCGVPPQEQIGGQAIYSKYTLFFFSDSNRTIPFDVSGLNFKVRIKSVNTVNDSESISYYFYENLQGNQTVVENDFLTNFEQLKCDGAGVEIRSTTNLYLEPFNGYLI